MTGKKRICFVSAESYQVLNPDCGRPHGGAEVQMTLLARAFAQRGYDVHLVTLDHGQPEGEVIDNVQIWGTHTERAGIPVLRFLHPRATGLFRALSRANAAVYVQSCCGMATGLTAWFCRRHGAAFVYRVASDLDCIPGKQFIKYARDRKLFEYGLCRADLVVAQSRTQQNLLAQNYGVEASIGGSLVERPTTKGTSVERNIDVLWAGAIRAGKRPELAITLGKRLPDTRFSIVGGPDRDTPHFFEDLQKQAENLKNVDLMGFRPQHITRSMFSDARVFLSTSEYEGFPNTFLQAWIAGTPVVAFVDPDGVIAQQEIGVVVRTLEEAKEAIVGLLNDAAWWRECSEKAKLYAAKHHRSLVVDRYENLIAPLFKKAHRDGLQSPQWTTRRLYSGDSD